MKAAKLACSTPLHGTVFPTAACFAGKGFRDAQNCDDKDRSTQFSSRDLIQGCLELPKETLLRQHTTLILQDEILKTPHPAIKSHYQPHYLLALGPIFCHANALAQIG